MSRRVAVVADRFPPAWGGGIASAHYHLVRLLAAAGFTVKAFTFFDWNEADDRDVVRRTTPRRAIRVVKRLCGSAFRVLEPGTAAYQTQDILMRAWGAIRLNRAIAAFQPDVLVLPDHGAPGLWIATPPGCRRVMIAHHNPSRFVDLPTVERFSRCDIRVAMALEDRALRRIDRVVCPSAYMAEVFAATHRFDGETVVAPNVIDPVYLDEIAAADPRPALGLPPEAALVYLPAGGNKFKGAGATPDIIRGLTAGGRSVGVYVSGAVPQELRAALPPDVPVWAPGPQVNPEVVAVVKACSFGVYPTLVENYSMALLEAALLGVPMATYDVGGNAEIVRDGVNGALVAAGDLAGLIRRATEWLEPNTAAAARAATLADARARLSATAVGGRVIAALTGVEG
ncbi:MAG: glycosyltransferase family 4 protein [Magnetospirillum sp.]|nr:glycosyltransferase family 4 protein [Magnetospirillum sp.]